MPLDELISRGAQVMTVCNACRYCEQYCPVFPAMEQRLSFEKADLTYLANLCHNCGECLYACQYAPPHEFGISVPKTLAEIRLRSYEEYAWPRALGAAFTHHSLLTGLGLAAALSLIMFIATMILTPDAMRVANGSADFYLVMPHGIMVGLFGGVFVFVITALSVGVVRFRRATSATSVTYVGATTSVGAAFRRPSEGGRRPTWIAIRDALTLRHLHATGIDCVSGEEGRSPWRRRFHHCTLYGFLLCFASTTVGAIYHSVFGWHAPYAYTSVPVILGTLGGLGLLAGSAGLWILRRQRDPAMGDPSQRGLDESFIALLFLTSLTGLALLVLRERAAMAPLLIVHLGTVLALFVTLPYGKFVHGLYRTAALIKFTRESSHSPAR
ncbi:MAG TPA: tricarballylate utilization 4Fe-4S protein TcuB [Vicinamibacterales bacterium]|nr:tricarballylate utilization 4Fe-4S protein TcuB [Vicinamibacterales bacterium]